jgi:hypothetical protein
MFIIIYKKSTKHIVNMRHDSSSDAALRAPQYWLDVYIQDSKSSTDEASDLAYVELAPREINLQIGKHVWNESTQQVDEDPNYVPPTPIAVTEPTV